MLLSRLWRATVVMVPSLVLLLLTAEPVMAQTGPDIQGAAEVRAKAARVGQISVIAELSPGPTGTLSASGIAAARSQLAQILAPTGVGSVRGLGSLPYVAMEVTPQQLDALLGSGRIRGVAENAVVRTNLFDSVPLIGAPGAWALGARGAGKAVVVVDSGVQSSHPFFGGRVVRSVCSASDCGSNIIDQPGAGEPNAGCYHGTHVAGIAAGQGSAFSGVAPNASIISVRVFQCNSGYWEEVIRGLDYIYTALRSQYSIAAVNMSLGDSTEYSSPCDDANTVYQAMATIINNLRSAGIATVVATGNNSYNGGISAPACIENAIAAGSTTKQDAVSYFSNSGPNVDVLAPGSDIYSSLLNGSFGYLSGTSMATPHVAGAFTAIRSKLPNATVAQIEQALETTGTSITDSDSGITRPRINVDDALAALGVSPGPVWRDWESFTGASLTSNPECLNSGGTQTDCWATSVDPRLGLVALRWYRRPGSGQPRRAARVTAQLPLCRRQAALLCPAELQSARPDHADRVELGQLAELQVTISAGARPASRSTAPRSPASRSVPPTSCGLALGPVPAGAPGRRWHPTSPPASPPPAMRGQAASTASWPTPAIGCSICGAVPPAPGLPRRTWQAR